jgi:hypothetical protein
MRADDRRLRTVSGGPAAVHAAKPAWLNGRVSRTGLRTIPMKIICGFGSKPVKSEASGAGPS